MKEGFKAGRVKTSFEELALSNMVLVEALTELLVEKGLLSQEDVMDQVKKLKAETRVDVNRTR